ncbi:MAG: WD40 repeat domain-containing protein [Planctomycetes bacterium]|nr:WD40 repeat domain-containing protein [Planctomycetota bacterium]
MLWVVDAGGAVVLGHDQHFEAISPDGLRIALADVTPDSKFKDVATTVLLEASSGKEIRKVEFGHAADPDFPVSIAPDASAVASIEGGRIRYRSLETDQAELEFGTGAKWLAWHGKALVTAHADGSVRWWSGGKVVRVVEKAIENLERVDVKSGCVLANGSERPEPRRFRDLACVLNADSGAVLDRFEMKGNPFAWGGLVFDFFGECDTRVFCSGKLALRLPASESGDSLWSGRTWFGGDRALVVGHKRMTLHDLAHGDATTALPQHVSRVHELEWFEEGLHVAGSDSSVLIGNDQLHSTAMLHYQAAITCGRHTLDLGPLGLDEVGKGAISADGRWLAVRMRNHVLFRPTDPAGEARVLGEDCPKDWQGAFPSHPIAIAADGSLVAAVSANLHSVDVWESSTGRRLATIAKEGSSIEDLEVVPGSCNIVVMGPCDDKTGLIRVFKPTGELVSSNKWPLYWTGSSHFVHGRWEIASKDIDDLPSEIWILDVTQAAPPVRLVLPSGGNFTMPCVHESGDGDHVIVENLQDRRVYLLSCRDSSVLPLGDWDLGAIGVAGFLDRVHPVRIGPGGLALYYGPTVEKVSCDPAIRGQALAVSPDGKRVAVADGGTVTVYELR